MIIVFILFILITLVNADVSDTIPQTTLTNNFWGDVGNNWVNNQVYHSSPYAIRLYQWSTLSTIDTKAFKVNDGRSATLEFYYHFQYDDLYPTGAVTFSVSYSGDEGRNWKKVINVDYETLKTNQGKWMFASSTFSDLQSTVQIRFEQTKLTSDGFSQVSIDDVIIKGASFLTASGLLSPSPGGWSGSGSSSPSESPTGSSSSGSAASSGPNYGLIFGILIPCVTLVGGILTILVRLRELRKKKNTEEEKQRINA